MFEKAKILNNEDSLLSQKSMLNLAQISRRNIRRALFWLFQNISLSLL